MTVTVFGAGSIGNHLSFACRNQGWEVTIVDVSDEALERTRSDIYPSRYGKWDGDINLLPANDWSLDQQAIDLAIIGTPPDSHVAIARQLLVPGKAPKVLLIENPLATPDMAGCAELKQLAEACGTCVVVDYNHTATPNTIFSERLIADGKIGSPLSLQVRWVEHWGGIFGAHPWLAGPADTYLGFSERGGGACGEHSHGISLWQHFAKVLGAGKIVKVQASMDRVQEGGADYDRMCQILVSTENGLHGSIIQDVVTEPATKNLRLQGSDGFLDWYANFDSGHDAVIHGDGSSQHTELFAKSRPDDFEPMIKQVGEFLDGRRSSDQLSCTLTDGLDTMRVIAAAFESAQTGAAVAIDAGS